MKHFRVTFFFLAVALTLSGCGIFGGSDGTELSANEDLEPQSTVTTVQPVPAGDSTTDGTGGTDGTGETAEDGTAAPAGAALPTAVTLPTAAPTPEPTVDRSQPSTYIVQSGDVLGVIAERFDADIAELRRVNGLDGNLIRVGQELTIPALDGSTTASDSTDESAAPAEQATSAPSGPAATSAPVSCGSTATGHCVQPGESLLGIALKYDVTVEALRAANAGISGDLIKSGEVLNLPGTTTTTDPDPAPAATAVPVAGSTPLPEVTVGPANDADCAARNPEFPYYHAADGLCYANPIDGDGSGSPTPIPTVAGGDLDQDCREGFFLWEDGLCYPIPGVTVTPDATTTTTNDTAATLTAVAESTAAVASPEPTTASTIYIYGRPPCDDWEVVLVSISQCWPEQTATDAQKLEGTLPEFK